MAAPKSRSAAKDTPGPASPPYYIAEQALYVGSRQFGRAFNPGDRVPVEHVEEHGWQDKVRLPDGYEPVSDQTHSEPATGTGQAPTSSEGKDA